MARLGPISQESLQERTYQALRAAILEGEYLPGERLFEGTIAEALQVSRNPVREALRRLQQDGLVRTQAHRGIYVTEVPEDEIEDVYRVRAALEGTAASLAAERMTAEEIRQLATILHEQEEAARAGDQAATGQARTPVSASQADSFHRLIHEGARSPMLLALLEQIYAQVSHFRKLTLRYPGRAAVSAAGHAQVYEAIRAHDAGAAERLMRGHVDGARLALVRELSEVKQAEAAQAQAAESQASEGQAPEGQAPDSNGGAKSRRNGRGRQPQESGEPRKGELVR